MKRWIVILLLLTVCTTLTSCGGKLKTKSDDEPSSVRYSWMAGDSPVPNQRVSLLRQGLIIVPYAISPTGVYFMEKGGDSKGNFILYGDHGSDTLIRLCGRADCNHNDEDCNAYLYSGSELSYYNNYLYGVSGAGPEEAECELVRMNPDGSNHVTVLDMLSFAKENGGHYIQCDGISDGVLLFSVYQWVEYDDGDPTTFAAEGTYLQSYYYRLDGSMSQPEVAGYTDRWRLIHDIPTGFCVWTTASKTGTENGSYWDWDPDTNICTYLTDHPGQPGWFDKTQAYYHLDGAIRRRDNATGTDAVMVETGLEGEYYLTAFPDCIVLTSRNEETPDNDMIYIYNWAFEAVDSVNLDYPNSDCSEDLLIAETSERFIFTNAYKGNPLYYIEKSELGTGNVQIYEFQYFR